MATILMIPVGPVITLNRSILLTERGMSGSGGDNFICGHCGSLMLENYDPSTIRGNPIYQCSFCENNNDLPFATSGADAAGDVRSAGELGQLSRPREPSQT